MKTLPICDYFLRLPTEFLLWLVYIEHRKAHRAKCSDAQRAKFALVSRGMIAPTTGIARMWLIDADNNPRDKQLTQRRSPKEKGR
jgi:hypothetical protein